MATAGQLAPVAIGLEDTPGPMARSVQDAAILLGAGGEADGDIARIHAVAAELQPGDVLVADANCGWTQHQAMCVAAGVRVAFSSAMRRRVTPWAGHD